MNPENMTRDQLIGLAEHQAFIIAEMTEPAPEFEFGDMHLTHSEARVFSILLRRKGMEMSRDCIIAGVNGQRPDVDRWSIPSVKVFICKIRRKMKLADVPLRIETIYGFGYRLVDAA